jgi:hypothetical protein
MKMSVNFIGLRRTQKPSLRAAFAAKQSRGAAPPFVLLPWIASSLRSSQ